MIKYGSNTHHILLMFRSANGTPKTVPHLKMISRKPKSDVERAIKMLLKHGLIEKHDAHVAWSITHKGNETLRYLARQSKTMKGKDNIDWEHWRTVENGRAAVVRARKREEIRAGGMV